MEGGSYVSCIRINGVPILPPLINDDIKREMCNYKQIAIRVEKKLATLRVAREQSPDIDAGVVKKNFRNMFNNSIEDPFRSDRNECQSKSETIANGYSPELLEDANAGSKMNSRWNGEGDADCTIGSRISLASDACSRSKLVSPKANKDQHTKNTCSIKSTTTETLSNAWKPQVPTTLNIVPMVLNDSDCGGDETHEKSNTHDAGETPKLIRQGSYVLDTPSPVLLAHMQMEHNTVAEPCTEYIPTSWSNKGHRREWNISRAKIEWENEIKSKSFVPTVPARSFELSPDKNRKSDSKVGQQRMHKSVSSLTIPATLSASYPATRSVDCIRTMLVNECIEESNVEVQRNGKYTVRNANEKRQDFQDSKKNNNFSTFELAHNERGNVPERAASSDSSMPFSNDLAHKHNQVPIDDHCTDEMSRNIDTEEDFASKLKLTVTSDKLVTVYKKVQEMHKNQMTELVTRQQREQTLLQEEFEKQQLLLLTEIRKSFPEISVSLLSENILPASFNRVTPDSEKLSKDIGSNDEIVKNLENNVQDERRIDYSRNGDEKLMPCPLDNTYSEIGLPAMESCFTVGKEEVKIQPDKDKSYVKILVKDGGGCKRLNVSRQLFPLDSKTVHVPILDRTVYGSKHIEAVNVINAYARGYLVRRMMRTERVIALKNTYREALHCMLKLHVDAPLNRSESNFLYRLQLQCDAASMNIVELFAHKPEKRMQVIAQDREIKQSRTERPTSARSYSFATQRTLARKKLKEMGEHQPSSFARSCLSRSRCQTWTSDDKEKILSPNILYHDIKRSTSAGTVRKPWR